MRQSLERRLGEQAQAQQAAGEAITRVGKTVDTTAADVKGLRGLVTTLFLVLLAAVGAVGVLPVVVHP